MKRPGLRRRDLAGLASVGILAPSFPGGAIPGARSIAIANGTNSPDRFSDGSSRWMTSRSAHFMVEEGRLLRFVHGNIGRGPLSGPNGTGPNEIEIRSQLEYPRGTFHALTFKGKKSAVVPPGQTVVTDVSSAVVPKRALFWAWINISASAAPGVWPLSRTANESLGDRVFEGIAENPIFDVSGREPNRSFGLTPLIILGEARVPRPSVSIVGDSLAAGHAGMADAWGGRGYVAWALRNEFAWSNFALPGDAAENFIGRFPLTAPLIEGRFTHVICALGIGDVRKGGEQRIRANLTRVWHLMAENNMKVFQTTITTETESTDGWLSATRQTLRNRNFAEGGLRHEINNWIRTKPPPLSGYFDVAAALETSLDSGIWNAPGGRAVTNDGVHLNPIGTALAAQRVDVGLLTAT